MSVEWFVIFLRCGVCYGGAISKEESNEKSGIDSCGRCITTTAWFSGKTNQTLLCPCPKGTFRDVCTKQCLKIDDPRRNSKSRTRKQNLTPAAIKCRIIKTHSNCVFKLFLSSRLYHLSRIDGFDRRWRVWPRHLSKLSSARGQGFKEFKAHFSSSKLLASAIHEHRATGKYIVSKCVCNLSVNLAPDNIKPN